ncbi:38324_t:CDS:1, partial [Gigaspora margarita]
SKKVNQFTIDTQSLQKQTFERHLVINDYQKAVNDQNNQKTTIIQCLLDN